jgi:single-strand DNA-binding protein
MANLNKVLLIGRLTRDPELRYTQGGTAVSEVGMAVNREWKNDAGEKKKDTCFVDVVLWGRRAEVVCQYLRKGSPLFVEGRLDFDQWQSPDGQKRSRLRVVADNFQFLDSGRGGGEDNRQESSRRGGSAPPRDDQRGDGPGDDFGVGGDDDVPF